MNNECKGIIKFEELAWVPTSYEFGTPEQARLFIEKISKDPNFRNIRITEQYESKQK